MDWIYKPEEAYAYVIDDPLGSASVVRIHDGRWRWEANSSSKSMALMMEMDGHWGFNTTREGAQQDAEEYLKRWS